jgi:GNAT superfamily N-acetyltransferase
VSADTRPAARADIPALLPLVEQYWIFEDIAGFDAARVGAVLERMLSEPAHASGWIAIANGQAVGYLLAVYVFSLEHRGLTAEIDEFFMLPSARGKGIGESLLALAEAEFARRRCTNVFLQLGRGNDKARAFYRRRGYGERAGFEMLDKMLPER